MSIWIGRKRYVGLSHFLTRLRDYYGEERGGLGLGGDVDPSHSFFGHGSSQRRQDGTRLLVRRPPRGLQCPRSLSDTLRLCRSDDGLQFG